MSRWTFLSFAVFFWAACGCIAGCSGRKCDPAEKMLGSLVYYNISGCSGDTCDIARGKDVELEFGFQSKAASTFD